MFQSLLTRCCRFLFCHGGIFVGYGCRLFGLLSSGRSAAEQQRHEQTGHACVPLFLCSLCYVHRLASCIRIPYANRLRLRIDSTTRAERIEVRLNASVANQAPLIAMTATRRRQRFKTAKTCPTTVPWAQVPGG